MQVGGGHFEQTLYCHTVFAQNAPPPDLHLSSKLNNSLAQQHLRVRQTENDKSFIAVSAYFVTFLYRASHEASVATCLRCSEKYCTILLGVYSLCSVERIFYINRSRYDRVRTKV